MPQAHPLDQCYLDTAAAGLFQQILQGNRRFQPGSYPKSNCSEATGDPPRGAAERTGQLPNIVVTAPIRQCGAPAHVLLRQLSDYSFLRLNFANTFQASVPSLRTNGRSKSLRDGWGQRVTSTGDWLGTGSLVRYKCLRCRNAVAKPCVGWRA